MEENQNVNPVNPMGEQQYAAPVITSGAYAARTFLWMFLGLAVTFAVAYLGYATNAIIYVLSIPYASLILLISELVVVIVLSARLHKISVTAARTLFFVYAILTGVVFSAYFLLYDVHNLILIFAATALYFGGMALFGYFTQIDLSRLRTVLISGLIALILFSVLSMFIPGLAMMERVMCMIGIVIFLAFTAYDTQKIRAFYNVYGGQSDMAKKASIYCALELYLDFINLFLYILRLFGKKK